MKDELGGKIMKELVGVTAKTYSYFKDNNAEDKKARGTKNIQNIKLMQILLKKIKRIYKK